MQRLAWDPFDSPLWHFIAVLGIDGESGQLHPAHLFTYVLAEFVYVGRALLSEFAVPARERSTMKDIEGRFAAVRDEWLCKATYSPMGYTLCLLLYGKKIARETGSRLMVSWNRQGDLMYSMGKAIAMDAIRTMVAEMITDAEDILWGELMFKEGDDVRFAISLDAIEDDLTHTHRGRSFIHTNGLDGKEVEMLEDLVRSRRKGDILDPSGEWRWEGIRKYQKSVRKFEELLVLAVQQTWGSGMARGDEIGGLRLVNGVNTLSRYYGVKSGEYCQLSAVNNTIRVDLFEAINPPIDKECTNLVPGFFYCVFPVIGWNNSDTTTSTYLNPPAPTLSGSTGNFYEWHIVVSGDDCSKIEAQYGLLIDQLRQWNPQLKSDCSNLLLDDAYCVHGDVPGTTTTTSSYVSAPAPTPSGMTSHCFQWHVVVSGGFCAKLQSDFSITFAQLQKWNPQLNSGCTNLLLDEAYCVKSDDAAARKRGLLPAHMASLATSVAKV